MDRHSLEASFVPIQDKEYQFDEGDLAVRTIRFRKRNQAIIEAKKRASRGVCDACGMRFSDCYTQLEKDCLEVHHVNPMAEREGATVTILDDLALICPNCHAVIHAFSPPLTIPEVKEKLR